jgi:hypothetical protein
MANPHASHLLRGLWTTITSDKQVILGSDSAAVEDLLFLGELEDIPIIYEITGSAGHTFWEKTEIYRYGV